MRNWRRRRRSGFLSGLRSLLENYPDARENCLAARLDLHRRPSSRHSFQPRRNYRIAIPLEIGCAPANSNNIGNLSRARYRRHGIRGIACASPSKLIILTLVPARHTLSFIAGSVIF